MPWFWAVVAGLYLFFSLLYAWLAARQGGSLQKGALWLVVCLALPGVGPLLLWRCDCRSRRAAPEDYRVFYRGSEFCPEDLRRLQPPDVAAETDRVPMEEALQVSDRAYRRRMVMQLLDVEDPLVYLPVLRRALANEDGETSHYASVAIMELRRKVQQQLDEAEARWRSAPPGRRSLCRLGGTAVQGAADRPAGAGRPGTAAHPVPGPHRPDAAGRPPGGRLPAPAHCDGTAAGPGGAGPAALHPVPGALPRQRTGSAGPVGGLRAGQKRRGPAKIFAQPAPAPGAAHGPDAGVGAGFQKRGIQ